MVDLDIGSKEERRRTRRRHVEVWGGVTGALVGAGMGGLAAGPPGLVAGLLAGTAMGASAAWAAHRGDSDAADRDSQLDVDIGVTGTDLGAPNLKHPPSSIGAFSAASSGLGAAEDDVTEAGGPIQPPPA